MALVRQIGTTLAVAAVSSGLVYLGTSLLPKVYSSQQVLIFPGSSPGMGNIASQILGGGQAGATDPSAFVGVGGVSSPVVGSVPNSAMGIMETRRCRQYVSEKLGLPARWKLSESKALAELDRRTKTKINDNGLVVVSCDTGSPEEARDIVKAMCDYLSTSAVQLTLNFNKFNRKTLEGRLAASEASVAKARSSLVATATNHPYVEAGPVQQLLTDALKKQGDARVEIAGAQARISSVESAVRRAVKSGSDITDLQASGAGQIDKGLESLIVDLQKRRLDLEDAKKTYTEKSPEFKAAMDKARAGQNAIKRALDDSNKSLQKGTYAPLIQAKSELEALKKAATGYERILVEYKRMALKTPEDASLFKLAQAQFDTALKTSESLRFQLEQAKVAEERDPARFEVVDEAVAEPDPISPRKGLITGGWFASVLAVGGWLILRKRITFVD